MTLRSVTATVALLLSALAAAAQTSVPQFTDPANLRGERVKPRDGRELPIDQGARGLEQLLRRLNTRASLMLIVAHPDDEDGGMLTYYSRGLGARVAMLTLTRGEGGQNAMTGDFEDALGLLRTQELLSADRYMGVDQFFGTEVDFGFSKTKEEAFKKWTHERVLYDAVRSIRLYRPLVIAAVFIGGVTDGHGQHQVSGQIAQEAFKAAADPAVFPDMIAEGILPWQALKVYARVPMQSISDKGLFDYATGKYTAPRFENYVTGEISTTVPSSDVVVHEGTTDPIFSDDPAAPPRSYVQFARIGLGLQKSQIGGGVRVPPAGAYDVAYHLYGSAPTKEGRHPKRSEGPATPPSEARPLEPSSHKPESASFFDDIDTSIEGIADLAPYPPSFLRVSLNIIDTDLKQAILGFDPSKPRLIAPKLADALKRIDILREEWKMVGPPRLDYESVEHELSIKRVQLNEALAIALGAELDATADNADIPQGSEKAVRVEVSVPADVRPLFPVTVRVSGKRGSLESFLEFSAYDTHKPTSFEVHPKLRPDITSDVTRPYFFRDSIEQPVYQLRDATLRNAPATPPALVAASRYSYNGVGFEVDRVVHSGPQPVSIVPPISLTLSSNAQILVRHREPGFIITATVKGDLVPPDMQIQLTGPKGWPISQFLTPSPSETEFKVIEPSLDNPPIATFSASGSVPQLGTYTDGYRAVGYSGLVSTNYFTGAQDRVVPVELNLPATHRIAYLPGTGDAVPAALASINLKPEILTVADLIPGKLPQYDTVILGVRTYAAHPDLHGAPTQALLDYARNGGNVLVQYQTAEFTAADAPYPLTLGYAAEKVVDETDPVQLLLDPKDAASTLLNTPNKITPADFNNWVEERGHGFLGSWDSHYTALTETHDPDQDPQRGGLITTSLGKGRWTYCAFALYRQLPEAVPGAYRLFVNLLTPAEPPTSK